MGVDPALIQLSPETLLHAPLNGGVNQQVLPYNVKDQVPNALNMLSFHDSSMQPFPGRIPLGSAPGADSVIHIARFDTHDDGTLLFAFTTAECFSWEGTSWLNRGVSLGGHYQYATRGVKVVDSDGDDFYIYTSPSKDILKFPVTGNGVVLAGATGNYRCREVGYLDSTLILVNTTETSEYPFRVRWSNKGDVETYTSADFVDLLEDSTPGMAFRSFLGQFGLIWKQRSIYSMTSTGDLDNPFRFYVEVKGIGTISGASVAVFGMVCFFLSEGAVYRWEIGSQPMDISGPIRALMFDFRTGLNRDASARSVGYIDSTRGLYWLSIPVNGSVTPNKTFVYHIETSRWFVSDYDITAFGEYQVFTAGRWDDYPATTIDALTGTYDSYGDPILLPIVLCGSSGTRKVLKLLDNGFDDDDTAVDHWIHSREWLLPGYKLRCVSLVFEALGTTVDVEYSLDGGITWTFLRTVILDATTMKQYVCPHEIFGERIRYRFRNSTLTGWFKLRWVLADGLSAASLEV